MQPEQIARYNRLLRALDRTASSKPKSAAGPSSTIADLIDEQNRQFDALGLASFAVTPDVACSSVCPSPSPPTPQSSPSKARVQIVEPPRKLTELSDLLAFVRAYPKKPDVLYQCGAVQWQRLHEMEAPLAELCRMVGMEELKRTVLDQVLYFLQDLHKSDSPENGDYLHTILCGPPGTGKTEVAKLLGQLYSRMGILSKGTFKKVVRSDLIAGYLGQTALKTKEAVKEALGGVLFIDEAYALGNVEKRDSFAKECIDTLCELASDHKNDLMVIVAGYEQELKDCFFSYNQGLETRFAWRFRTEAYSAVQLHQIFLKRVADAGWNTDPALQHAEKWFEEKLPDFPNQGRDMEMLLTRSKIAYGRRTFLSNATAADKMLTLSDVEAARTALLQHRQDSSATQTRKDIWQSMYC